MTPQANDSTVSVWTQLEDELDLTGRYVILSKIGEGGMGNVFKARHLALDRIVAIKVLANSDKSPPEAIARFEREGKALSSLEHPNILKLYSVSSQVTCPFIITDYLEGETLADRLRRGPLTVIEFASIFSQVIDALTYANSKGFIHRDIKPSNIFLENAMEGIPKAVLLDFGLVRTVDKPGQDATLTATKAVLGSPHYMSPEQCRGEAVDWRSDAYSVGCTMYESLSGSPPFCDSSIAETLLKQMNTQAPALIAYRGNKQIQSSLADFILKCLEKDPEKRPSTPESLAAELKLAIEAAPIDVKVQTAQFTNKTKSTRAKWLILASVATLVVSITVAFLTKDACIKTSKDESAEAQRIERLIRRAENAATPNIRFREIEALINLWLEIGGRERRNHNWNKATEACKSACEAAKSIPQRRWAAKAFAELAEVYLDQHTFEKKSEYLDKASSNIKHALRIAGEGNDYDWLMVQTRVQLRQRRFAESTHSVSKAIRSGRSKIGARNFGASYARDFAKIIQSELEVYGTTASSSDKVAFCSSFLELCEFISNSDKIHPNEPALKYAHKWFAASSISNDPTTATEFNLDALRKQLDYFDNLEKRSE